MIGISANGRLGNQMFQYAFILKEARKQQKSFFIDERFTKFSLNEYFLLDDYSNFINKYRQFYFRLFYRNRKIKNIEHIKPPNENIKKINSDDILYNGFFQSEEYFKNPEINYKKVFKVKKEYKIDNICNYLKICSKPIISIHIRRTDYIAYGNETLGGVNLTLPLDYYKNALAKIENIFNYNLIFISDDIDFVKKELVFPNAIYTNNEMMVDFQIMQKSQIIITANSSFSWWAAYLSDAEKIFAPKYWLGFKIKKEYPHSVIPFNWHQIEF